MGLISGSLVAVHEVRLLSLRSCASGSSRKIVPGFRDGSFRHACGGSGRINVPVQPIILASGPCSGHTYLQP